MEEKDTFFEPQSPEEEALFAGDRPPTDITKKPDETPVDQPKKDQEPSDVVKEKDVPDSSPASEEKPPENDGRRPNQAADEPDWKYNMRLKIWNAHKAEKSAQTPEEKEVAKQKTEDARRELAKRTVEKTQKPSKEDDDVLNTYDDPNLLESDKNRVRALGKEVGFASKEDARQEVQNFMKEEREKETQNQALNDFFDEYKEIYGEDDNRDIFFNTVEKYFQYQNKSYEELRFMFQSAHDALYPKNLEETIAKSEVLKEKMKASQFNGGSAAEAKPKDAEKEKIRKEFADKGEDVSWLLDD